MKIFILSMILLLTGCVANGRYIAANSVNVGDDYNTMKAKMGGLPQRVKCLTVSKGDICTVTYQLGTHDYAFFKFNLGNKITSIYR